VTELQKTVHQVVLEVARERTPSLPQVEDHQALHADLGLKSLELARIVAVLELELEADPFAELVSITSVRRVGDLVEAYRRFLAGEQPPQDEALREGERRAQARREALASRRRGRPDAP
jgi:hypothetical protein